MKNFKGHNFVKDIRYKNLIDLDQYVCESCGSTIRYTEDIYFFWLPGIKEVRPTYYNLLEVEMSCDECIIKQIIE